jgi:hypothetical protein
LNQEIVTLIAAIGGWIVAIVLALTSYFERRLQRRQDQAIYLLLESGQGDARHEFHNWLRIMKLLLSTRPEAEFQDMYIELIEALNVRAKDTEYKPGITISTTTAKSWLGKVRNFAAIS